MTAVFINIVNGFTHMESYGNIEILCCFLCLQAMFLAAKFFLYTAVMSFYFSFVFSAVFTIWHQLSVLYEHVKIILHILLFWGYCQYKSIKFILNPPCIMKSKDIKELYHTFFPKWTTMLDQSNKLWVLCKWSQLLNVPSKGQTSLLVSGSVMSEI